jgi:hypothetical protein
MSGGYKVSHKFYGFLQDIWGFLQDFWGILGILWDVTEFM